jgi:hypothetical protein
MMSESSQILKQRDSCRPTSSHANSGPGFFAGASHVDASHSVFSDIAGDLYISTQDNGMLVFANTRLRLIILEQISCFSTNYHMPRVQATNLATMKHV